MMHAGSVVPVTDRDVGIFRERRGRGFVYRDHRGRRLTDAQQLARIRALAIPPAYEQVWICDRPEGHLQATGIDARGRRQYRYHPAWREEREREKFARMAEFGSALTRIRRRVARDVALPRGATIERRTVLATLVRLLDTTLARVGNDAYARENRSFGLTTLRNRHAQVRGSEVRLRFRGKSGVLHDLSIDDPTVAAVVRRCLGLPGAELFQYVDEAGEPRAIASADVNDYLREIAGIEITAKDFRTWHASVLAFDLARIDAAAASARGRIRRVLGQVAQQLGNTLAVCRKSYVHPRVLALLGAPAADPAPRARRRPPLRQVECDFLAFLVAPGETAPLG